MTRRTGTALVALLVGMAALLLPVSSASAAAGGPYGLIVSDNGDGTKSVFVSAVSGSGNDDGDDTFTVSLSDGFLTVQRFGGDLVLDTRFPDAILCSQASSSVVNCSVSALDVNVFTGGGSDSVNVELPDGLPTGLNIECGAGTDLTNFNTTPNTGANASINILATKDCESRVINGGTGGPDPDPDPDPEPEPEFEQTVLAGLTVVKKEKIDVAPSCARRDGCGSFEYTFLTDALRKLHLSGLNIDLTIKRLTTRAQAEKLLASRQIKKGKSVPFGAERLDNFVADQVTFVEETFYAATNQLYTANKLSTGKVRASAAYAPHKLTLYVFSPPLPAGIGECPYGDGIYTDIDPRTKGKQAWDLKTEFNGYSVGFSITELEKKYGCDVGDIVKGLNFSPKPTDTTLVTSVIPDSTDEEMDVVAKAPARSDLVLQLSGRGREDWIAEPDLAGEFDSELGPLVDGTFALAPDNVTSVAVQVFERGTGAQYFGPGIVEVLDASGLVLDQVRTEDLLRAPLEFVVEDTTELRFRFSALTTDGLELVGIARRAVVDAGEIAVTARGAVFRRSDTGEYLLDTETPLEDRSYARACRSRTS